MQVVEKVSSALEMSRIMVTNIRYSVRFVCMLKMVKVGFAGWMLPLLYSTQIHQRQL